MEFNVGDIIHCQVTKADKFQDAGLRIEEKPKGRYFIKKVEGLFLRRGCPVQPGDELLRFMNKNVDEYKGGLKEMKAIMKEEMRIMISIERNEPPSEEESESTAEPEPEPPQEQFPQIGYYDIRPGDVMALEGLAAKPELNGEVVTVVEEADKPGRWMVELHSTGEIISVAASKLVHFEEEEYVEEEEEPMLALENGGTSSSAVTTTSNIKPGMNMKLFKLKKKAKMNGTHVKVVKRAPTAGRWQVKVISSGEVLSIAEANLKPV